MKTLKALLVLLFLASQVASAQGFFYFGNSNLVGTGKMEGNAKEGVWKIYARKELVENPSPAISQVDDVEVKKNFSLAVPLYQLEFKNNQLDGVFEEFYAEGSTKKVVNYKKGMLDGDFFEFSREGELLFSGAYFEGEKSGDWVVYRSDGSIKSEYSYQNNLLDGQSITYFPDGQVAERMSFQSGKVSGLYESFFQDGSPKQRVTFVGGEEDGEFTQYHIDGKRAVSAIFSKGVLDGPWQSYDDQGQLFAEGTYHKGERVGQWKEIYPDVLGFYTAGSYQEGKKAGTWKVLGEADFVHQEEVFQADMLLAFGAFTTRSGLVLDAGDMARGNGRRTIYDGEGQRLEKGRYTNGYRTGMWYSFFPKTNLVASKGTYVAGQKRGTWKQYDFQGQLVSEELVASGQATDSQESADPLEGASGTARSRFYKPVQPNKVGMVNPRIMVLTPDGGMGFSGPGMFQLGN